MNHINHINFAKRILSSCQLDPTAGLLANLPAFISRGKFYNSMFTHALSHLPDLLEVAGDVLSHFEEQNENEEKTRQLLDPTLKSLENEVLNSKNYMQQYFHKKRLLFYGQLLDHVKEIGEQYKLITGEDKLPTSSFYKDQQTALFLAFLSFIYIDLWVNPRQLFFPATAVCSGSWALWEDIDYFKFTETFLHSEPKEIAKNMLQDEIWQESFDPFAMVKCMIIRMGEKGSPSIAYSIIDWNIRIFLRYLGVNDYKRGDAELTFLKKLEVISDSAIRDAYKKL